MSELASRVAVLNSYAGGMQGNYYLHAEKEFRRVALNQTVMRQYNCFAKVGVGALGYFGA